MTDCVFSQEQLATMRAQLHEIERHARAAPAASLWVSPAHIPWANLTDDERAAVIAMLGWKEEP